MRSCALPLASRTRPLASRALVTHFIERHVLLIKKTLARALPTTYCFWGPFYWGPVLPCDLIERNAHCTCSHNKETMEVAREDKREESEVANQLTNPWAEDTLANSDTNAH